MKGKVWFLLGVFCLLGLMLMPVQLVLGTIPTWAQDEPAYQTIIKITGTFTAKHYNGMGEVPYGVPEYFTIPGPGLVRYTVEYNPYHVQDAAAGKFVSQAGGWEWSTTGGVSWGVDGTFLGRSVATNYWDEGAPRSLKTTAPAEIWYVSQLDRKLENIGVRIAPPFFQGGVSSVDVLPASITMTIEWAPTEPIIAENHPPTVTLTYSPQNPTNNDAVSFEADASDPDGDSLSYMWFLDEVHQSATSSAMELTNPLAGTHTMRVMVDDGKGSTAQDSVEFSVQAAQQHYVIMQGTGDLNGEGPIAFVKEISVDGKVTSRPDTPLYTGAYFKTGPGVEILVKFSAGAVTRVKENSYYSVLARRMATTSQSEIYTRLYNGILHFYTKDKLAEKFGIATDRVVVSIKGTDVTIEHAGGTTTIAVAEGEVEVMDKSSGLISKVLAGETVQFDGVSGTGGTGTSGAASLVAESRTVAPGDQVTVPVKLQNASDVSSMNFNISYSASVVKVVSVDKGSMLSGISLVANPNESGIIRFGFATEDGVDGTGSIGHIIFEAIGSTGSSSPLTISGMEVTNSSGDAISLGTQDGTVTINSDRLLGDYNGDGLITELDALAALKMSVKLLAEDSILDMDQNGRVTSEDARRILSIAVRGS